MPENDTGTDDVAELRRQLESYKSRAETAEAVGRTERQGRIRAERQTLTDTQRRIAEDHDNVEGKLESLAAEAERIEERIAELSDVPGNGKEIAKLITRQGQIAAENLDSTRKRDYLKAQIDRFAKGGAVEPENTGTDADGRKLLANGQSISQFPAPSQAWLLRHPEAFTNAGFLEKVFAAAAAATKVRGHAEDTDGFFRDIEEQIGERQAASQTPDPEDGEEIVIVPKDGADKGDLRSVEKPQSGPAGPGSMSRVAAAAPTRATPTGGSGGGGNRKISLSREEAEVAQSFWPTLSPQDAAVKYAESRTFMKARNPGHFMNRAN